MGLIRERRERRGLSLAALAERAGVTPMAVTFWQKSEEAGTIQLGTLSRALDLLGDDLELVVHERAVEPRTLDIGQRVALELHRAVAVKLVQDPDRVLGVVEENAERIRSRIRGDAPHAHLDEWVRLARGRRIGRLVDVMLGIDEKAIAMRQTSPFMGVLSAAERARAIEAA